MLQPRQRLAFARQQNFGTIALAARTDHLERHALTEIHVAAFGQVHRAQAAAADLVQHAERTDALSRQQRQAFLQQQVLGQAAAQRRTGFETQERVGRIAAHRDSSRLASCARAWNHRRCTVRTETPAASAVSVSLMPAKKRHSTTRTSASFSSASTFRA